MIIWFLLGLIVTPLVSVLYGWVLSIMWNWFMVGAFGVPTLSIVYAVGVAMTIKLITYQSDIKAKTEEEEEEDIRMRFVEGVSMAVGMPLLILLFGWIVHLFI